MPTEATTTEQPAKQQYDYNTPIFKSSSELAKLVVSIIPKYQDTLLAPPNHNRTKEESAKMSEVGTDFAIEVMKAIIASDLPYDYAAFGVDLIIETLEELKKFIVGSVSRNEKELLSLTIGKKSAANGSYRSEEATFGDMLIALDEMRTKRGVTAEDAVNVKAEDTIAPEIAA